MLPKANEHMSGMKMFADPNSKWRICPSPDLGQEVVWTHVKVF